MASHYWQLNIQAHRSPGRPITKTNGQLNSGSKKMFCGFCRTNGEPSHVYENHITKNSAGKVVCPQLYHHICEVCGATGPDAHTRSYCPLAELGRSDPFMKEVLFTPSPDKSFHNSVSLKKTRLNSAGRRRRQYGGSYY